MKCTYIDDAAAHRDLSVRQDLRRQSVHALDSNSSTPLRSGDVARVLRFSRLALKGREPKSKMGTKG